MAKEMCCNCYYCESHENYDRKWYETDYVLRCHRYPPNEINGLPSFPMVGEFSWCGEFKPKEREEDYE